MSVQLSLNPVYGTSFTNWEKNTNGLHTRIALCLDQAFQRALTGLFKANINMAAERRANATEAHKAVSKKNK